MSGLSDEDRESLQRVFAGRSTMPSELAPTVEAIVTRAVNEALNEAADAIQARFDEATRNEPHDPFCLEHDLSTTEIERNGWLSGLKTAASVVRRRATN